MITGSVAFAAIRARNTEKLARIKAAGPPAGPFTYVPFGRQQLKQLRTYTEAAEARFVASEARYAALEATSRMENQEKCICVNVPDWWKAS